MPGSISISPGRRGESQGSIPCPRLQGELRASSRGCPWKSLPLLPSPMAVSHQAGGEGSVQELCRNCAGIVQEMCRKDAGRMQEAHLTHFLTISSLSIASPSGRQEHSLTRGPHPSSCTSLLPWLCLLRPSPLVSLQSRVRVLHQGSSPAQVSPWLFQRSSMRRAPSAVGFECCLAPAAMAGTKQNQHSRAVI